MKKTIFKALFVGLVTFSFTSCDVDINYDPYAVSKIDIAQLLTATEYEVGVTFAEGNYLNANFSSYVHHTVSREIDNYSLISSYSTLGNTWSQAYIGAIHNCKELVRLANEMDCKKYAGVGMILESYMFLNMVDLWGDIPYTEACKEGVDFPKADSSAFIYNGILAELNDAIEALNDTVSKNSYKPDKNDLFYGGDIKKWVKVANTLKLKLLVQSRKAKAEVDNWQAELDYILGQNDAFIGKGEDLQFPHTTTITPMDERNSGFVDEYEGGQKSVFISPWFYEILNGKTTNFTDNPFKGIKDPRVPYYYYNQAKATDNASNETDYRDGAFISIMAGSNSGYASQTQENVMSVVGIYPVGGKYDDGKGGKISAKAGSGAAPDKMLQAYSVPFLKAELVLTEGVAGDARALLQEGILASIDHVNAVAKTADDKAPTIDATTANGFVGNVLAKYDATTTDDKKMEIIMTQKWIANFYNPVEAYNDIRRTGYPILFTGDENNLGWTPYAHTKEPTPALDQIELVSFLKYPRVMYYPNDETDVNPNLSNKDRVVSDKTLFWDK